MSTIIRIATWSQAGRTIAEAFPVPDAPSFALCTAELSSGETGTTLVHIPSGVAIVPDVARQFEPRLPLVVRPLHLLQLADLLEQIVGEALDPLGRGDAPDDALFVLVWPSDEVRGATRDAIVAWAMNVVRVPA